MIFLTNEEHDEDKNGIRRESVPIPCDVLAYHILKYIPCEGKWSILYAYQLILLYKLRFQAHLLINKLLSIPFSLL